MSRLQPHGIRCSTRGWTSVMPSSCCKRLVTCAPSQQSSRCFPRSSSNQAGTRGSYSLHGPAVLRRGLTSTRGWHRRSCDCTCPAALTAPRRESALHEVAAHTFQLSTVVEFNSGLNIRLVTVHGSLMSCWGRPLLNKGLRACRQDRNLKPALSLASGGRSSSTTQTWD